MDKIWIKDLEIFAYHGVLAEEKRNGQKFYVTVSMDVDLHAAGMTDDLDKTVNYAEVCELIRYTFFPSSLSAFIKCQEIASPSRSGSVAR